MNEELQDLLRSPREDLDIELKRWMDPADKAVQAKFAKELLALRHHGGGYLVIGFKDEHPPVADPDRPASLDGFSTDVFNNVLKKYAEPPFHCMSHVVTPPLYLSQAEHLAEGGQPGVSAFDHPAVAPEPVIALNAFAGDAVFDAPALEMSAAARIVVALVGVQFGWPSQGPAALATHVWQRIHQLLEDHRMSAMAHPGS